MHAEKCPVCDGCGRYTPLPDPNSSAGPITQPCHGCNGKGWVEVSEAYPYVPPYTPPAVPGTTWPYPWYPWIVYSGNTQK
jgi:hypothetical protein